MNKRPEPQVRQELGNAFANLGFLNYSIQQLEKNVRKLNNDLLGAHKRCHELDTELASLVTNALPTDPAEPAPEPISEVK